MADAYGAVVLSYSEDADIDKEQLLAQLNRFRWSNDGTQWEIVENSLWFGTCQYPTAFPHVTSTIDYKDGDGNIHTVPFDEATEEQFDAQVDWDEDEMTLEQFSTFFEPCIKKGSITIAATSNEKCRYVEYQAVTITSDGDVSSVCHFVGTSPHYDSKHVMEEYSRGGEVEKL